MEGKLCPVGVGSKHDFESYLVATLPPDDDQLNAADLGNQLGGMVKGIIEAMTAKRFLVACKHCGMVLGGYSGKTEPEIVEDNDDPQRDA